LKRNHHREGDGGGEGATSVSNTEQKRKVNPVSLGEKIPQLEGGQGEGRIGILDKKGVRRLEI